jgi:hypothetical protein
MADRDYRAELEELRTALQWMALERLRVKGTGSPGMALVAVADGHELGAGQTAADALLAGWRTEKDRKAALAELEDMLRALVAPEGEGAAGARALELAIAALVEQDRRRREG